MSMNLTKYIYDFSTLLRKAGFNFHEQSDPKVIAMQKKINEIGKIEFKIEQYPDGSWTAESVNIDGIITGGKNTEDTPAILKDAVFTFFEIPPHLCADSILRSDNEPVLIKQNVYVQS